MIVTIRKLKLIKEALCKPIVNDIIMKYENKTISNENIDDRNSYL